MSSNVRRSRAAANGARGNAPARQRMGPGLSPGLELEVYKRVFPGVHQRQGEARQQGEDEGAEEAAPSQRRERAVHGRAVPPAKRQLDQ